MRSLLLTALALAIAGCASTPAKPPGTAANAKSEPYSFTADPYPSTYRAIASPPVLVSGATVLTGDGGRLEFLRRWSLLALLRLR